MSFDNILQHLGEFGAYQRRIFLLIIAIPIPIAFHSCSIVFNLVEPPFRCAVPSQDNDTYVIKDEAHRRLVNASIPYDVSTGFYSQCSAYADNGVSDGNKTRQVSCERWVYEESVAVSSIVAYLDLVCERKVLRSHITMIMMMGLFVGSIVGGMLGDVFGRKRVLIIATILQALAATGFAFVTSLPVILAARFFMATLGFIMFMLAFIIVVEMVGPSKRSVTSMVTMLGWAVGLLILTLIYYLIRDWRTAQLVIAIPGLLVIFYFWLIPESPRWLMSRNRLTEAEAIIRQMAKANGVHLPEEMEVVSLGVDSEDPADTQTKGENHYIWHLLTSRVLCLRVSILAFGWCTVSMVYYGLTLNVGDLVEGNIYVNFGLQAFMELVAYIICIFVLEKVGRKKVFCFFILLGGIACLATVIPVLMESDIKWVNVVLFGIGKFGVTGAFATIYIITAEQLPTSVRNSGIGFCSFLGRVGGVVSPYIAGLGSYVPGKFGPTLPLFIFGTCSVITGLSFLLLPETRNRKLPETIEDAKNLRRSKSKSRHQNGVPETKTEKDCSA